jgi:hypothetical protein
MTQPTPTDAPISPEALLLRVASTAGVEIADIRKMRNVTKTGPWAVNAPFPGDMAPFYTIFAMFKGAQGERSTRDAHVPGELRCYCIPRMRFYPRGPGDRGPDQEVPFVCYTILGLQNGITPTVCIRTETIEDLDEYVEEIAFEFRQQAILLDWIQDGEDCPNEACEVLFDPDDEDARFCKGCGTKLPTEEEPETSGQTQPAPPPSLS